MRKMKERLNDFAILLRRALGFSHYEMTTREKEDLAWRATALRFDSEQEFRIYAMTHKYPLGRCLIYYGRNERRYDDTLDDKPKYKKYKNHFNA